jgi:hypothetical protein
VRVRGADRAGGEAGGVAVERYVLHDLERPGAEIADGLGHPIVTRHEDAADDVATDERQRPCERQNGRTDQEMGAVRRAAHGGLPWPRCRCGVPQRESGSPKTAAGLAN